MNKKMLQQAIENTQLCLTKFWQNDYECVMSFCDESVIWIGSQQSQFCFGYNNTLEDLKSVVAELQPCHLNQQEFFVTQNCGKACTIVGKYYTTTDDNADFYLQVQQRCTFVWESIDGTLKIKHIHVSNPLGELKVAENEKFVNTIGQIANKYLNYKLNEKYNSQKLFVTDEYGVSNFIPLSDIIYIVAERKLSKIFTSKGIVVATLGISKIKEQLNELFVSVHRSFVVNIEYISLIKRYSITMADQTDIPIPAKKYNDIVNEINKIYSDIKNT